LITQLLRLVRSPSGSRPWAGWWGHLLLLLVRGWSLGGRRWVLPSRNILYRGLVVYRGRLHRLRRYATNRRLV
jgi:hypothetical protein